MTLKGNLVDVLTEKIYPAEITVKNGKIFAVREISQKQKTYLLPGLIDSHLHIESSMLCPSRFAQIVVPHGTTAVVSDPHEIANVLGMKGINYMLKDARTVPLKIFWTAPSCVPATAFETTGAEIKAKDIKKLLAKKEFVALGEMMNYPGVINVDKEVLVKIALAKFYKKPIDGHLPLPLIKNRGPLFSKENIAKYISSGITTCHESTTCEEAKIKAKLGMKIMLREKNLPALAKIAEENPRCFLVTDDKPVAELRQEGHLDYLLKKAVSLGIKPVRAVKFLTLNPAQHYRLKGLGAISPGKKADIVETADIKNFRVKRVWLNGKLTAQNGRVLFKTKPKALPSSFKVKGLKPDSFKIFSPFSKKQIKVRIIVAQEGKLLTGEKIADLPVQNRQVLADAKKDILKIAVVERYGHARIGLGFVQGFGLKKGAIASSVAHDSHNIIVVGANDTDMAEAVNLIVEMKGGIAAVNGRKTAKLALPVAGLMSDEEADKVAQKLNKVKKFARMLDSPLQNPFMTMSFLALLVIPELKISDQGLFDAKRFRFVSLFV